MKKVLEGIRVLDFTERVQGPFASQILGDLGADVIKVERVNPKTPDGRSDERYLDGSELPTLYSATFLANNRNKRSIAINLKDPEGIAIVHQLVATSDVLCENFRPGVMNRLGLGYEKCLTLNEKIIYLSSTGYGSKGPYSEMPGQDLLAQAISGMGQMNLSASGHPQPVGMSITDLLGGIYGALAVVSAILHRNQTQEGQLVEVDLLSSAISVLNEHAVHFLNNENVGEPQRLTEMHGHGYIPPPYGFYKTSDGHVALAGGSQIPELCKILGTENLLDNEKFATYQDRLLNRVEMEQVLEKALQKRSTSEWMQFFKTADIFAAPVNTFSQAFENKQVEYQNLIVETENAGSKIKLVAPAIKMSKTPLKVRMAPPRHGEHTKQILNEMGFDDQEIELKMERGSVA
jgi:crotonobetainyl-CoA:carnitine CoA-transferase CaiB-like acyl-CoA transferase